MFSEAQKLKIEDNVLSNIEYVEQIKQSVQNPIDLYVTFFTKTDKSNIINDIIIKCVKHRSYHWIITINTDNNLLKLVDGIKLLVDNPDVRRVYAARSFVYHMDRIPTFEVAFGENISKLDRYDLEYLVDLEESKKEINKEKRVTVTVAKDISLKELEHETLVISSPVYDSQLLINIMANNDFDRLISGIIRLINNPHVLSISGLAPGGLFIKQFNNIESKINSEYISKIHSGSKAMLALVMIDDSDDPIADTVNIMLYTTSNNELVFPNNDTIKKCRKLYTSRKLGKTCHTLDIHTQNSFDILIAGINEIISHPDVAYIYEIEHDFFGTTFQPI